MFLDDFTHWRWTTSIPNKNYDTVRKAFHDLVKSIENEMELKIKFLHIDRGKEYKGCLLPLLKEMGILSEKTPPYSSPSNGKAEWLNRTLNEHIR